MSGEAFETVNVHSRAPCCRLERPRGIMGSLGSGRRSGVVVLGVGEGVGIGGTIPPLVG